MTNRPRGRLRQRWLDKMNEDLIMEDVTAKLEIALDRNKWKNLMEAAKGSMASKQMNK